MYRNDYILTLSCPDRTGIVYNVSGLLLKHQGNIIDAQQFGDAETGNFFLRVHFALPEEASIEQIKTDFVILAPQFEMTWEIHDAQTKARLMILVSKQGHCLNDLLYRVHAKQLQAEIAAVVSNHQDFEPMARSYGIPFHFLPVTPETKSAQESQIMEIVKREKVDLLVLARYMQILSPEVCALLGGKAINIHHSFLPSFKGARPYYQAHARGVKIIGATAHYVTHDLDEGPIIEQDVQRVDHTMSALDLTRVGSDIESRVLSRAVASHVEHRILLNGSKTVVFR
jgi:formyltetrahydrofolate deformylase